MAENSSPEPPPSYEQIMGMPTYVNAYTPIQATQSTSNVSPSAPPYNLTNLQTATNSANNQPKSSSNIDEDFVQIEKALQLNDPDVVLLMSVLCHRNYDDRMAIAQKYQQKYGKPLIQQIKHHFNWDFCRLMTGLVIPYHEYLARTIHDSLGFKWLYYVLFTVSNREIVQMKEYFEAKYNKSIEEFTNERTSKKNAKNIMRLRPIVKILEARRNEELDVDLNEVKEDVRRLNTIVGGTFLGGSFEEKQIVKDIFYFKSFNHIKAVAYEYTEQHNGKHICFVIYKVYSAVLNIFMSIIDYAINKEYYFATLLKKSMKGMGTNDKLLRHVMVRRFNVGDLTGICTEFNRQNEENLEKWINDDTSGHYKDALFELIGVQPRKGSAS